MPTDGYITTVGTTGSGTSSGVYNPGHPKGAVRCKFGNTSGTTCGLITQSTSYSISYTGKVMDGMVEVGQSSQPVIAAAGDSGAPIFTEPVWSSANSRYEIKAAGIMHAANLYPVNPVYVGAKDPKRPCDSRYDADPCIFIYMPIDRVNDLGPLNLKVYQGSTQVFVAP